MKPKFLIVEMIINATFGTLRVSSLWNLFKSKGTTSQLQNVDQAENNSRKTNIFVNSTFIRQNKLKQFQQFLYIINLYIRKNKIHPHQHMVRYHKTFLFVVLLLVLAQIKCANSTCKEDCCGKLAKRPAQTFTFYQNTGRFTGGKGSYAINTKTYAGAGSGYLNPAKQCVKNTGPPPVNSYKLAYCKNTMHNGKTRPCSFYMEPQDPKKMCGRSQFFVHGCGVCTKGDDTQPPAPNCSAGCIIMNHSNRKKLRVGDTINVVAKDPK